MWDRITSQFLELGQELLNVLALRRKAGKREKFLSGVPVAFLSMGSFDNLNRAFISKGG